MGLQTKRIEEHEFHATIHTLTCEVTGKKLANILVKKPNEDLEEDVFIKVRALSPFADNADSGWHKIGGLLSYGPISREDSPRFPTDIIDIEYDIIDGEEIATLIVGEVGED